MDDDRLASIEASLAALVERVQAAALLPRFLDLRAAAVYSSLSVKALRGMIRRGDLPACRPLRGKLVVERAALDAAILSTSGRIVRSGRGLRPR